MSDKNVQEEQEKRPIVDWCDARERGWPEDWPHENGNYFGRCLSCGFPFVGHKRRVVCKQCATAKPPAASPASPSPSVEIPPSTLLEAVESANKTLKEWEELVARCHTLLDKAGVAACPAGTICDDPECNSKLEHRIHFGVSSRVREAEVAAYRRAAEIARGGIYSGDYYSKETDAQDSICFWIEKRILSLIPTDNQEESNGR